MKIDLHVHSQEYSLCGRSTAEEQVCTAIAAGLDALVFSNHNRFVRSGHLQQLNEQYAPFRIFNGIEIDVEGEHILVCGSDHPALQRRGWTYPDLYRFIQNEGGFMALAHPFRFNHHLGIDPETFPPDAIEGYSTNIASYIEDRCLDLADQLGLPVLSNSDAHHTTDIGSYYNVLDQVPRDEQELVELLKAGQFRPVSLSTKSHRVPV